MPLQDLLFGWVDIPARRAAAAAFPAFRDAAPDLMDGASSRKPVLLHRALIDVLGGFPAWAPQAIGDCVSFGHGHGVDVLQCVENALGGNVGFAETCTEWLYAVGRKAGNMLGPFDGCYGAAMTRAMVSAGCVSRAQVPADLGGPAYSGKRAKSWGFYGPPSALADVGARCKLGAAALVSTIPEADAALHSGHPVTVSSNQGFTLQRDQDGFCAARGSWGHCMVILGRRYDRPGFLILNSWPPSIYSGPLPFDAPPCSFWAAENVVARMLAQGDSFALSGSPVFKTRPLPKSWRYDVA